MFGTIALITGTGYGMLYLATSWPVCFLLLTNRQWYKQDTRYGHALTIVCYIILVMMGITTLIGFFAEITESVLLTYSLPAGKITLAGIGWGFILAQACHIFLAKALLGAFGMATYGMF